MCDCVAWDKGTARQLRTKKVKVVIVVFWNVVKVVVWLEDDGSEAEASQVQK